jgi:hypothetical protein
MVDESSLSYLDELSLEKLNVLLSVSSRFSFRRCRLSLNLRTSCYRFKLSYQVRFLKASVQMVEW